MSESVASKMSSMALTPDLLDEWATDLGGPVALHVKQRLRTVESEHGESQLVYPPTYAGIGYNIDTLADGTQVALIDSVGAQANRMEPAFKHGSGKCVAELVPQVDIIIRKDDCGECTNCNKERRRKTDGCLNPLKEKRSIFDLAHRITDSVVLCTPTLQPIVAEAFERMRRTGDASLVCAIAPTSLLFGCWDSRGGSGERRPRLIRSIVRAWDVVQFHSAAQFNSIWKYLSQNQKDELKSESMKKGKSKLADKGLNDTPAVTYRDGRRVLGGVVVHGPIQRDITINLVALRQLSGSDKTDSLRKYLLALSILTGTLETDLFLREGCHLKYSDEHDNWIAISRRGPGVIVDLDSDAAQETLRQYAAAHYEPFRQTCEELRLAHEHEFDLDAAKKMLGATMYDDGGNDV